MSGAVPADSPRITDGYHASHPWLVEPKGV